MKDQINFFVVILVTFYFTSKRTVGANFVEVDTTNGTLLGEQKTTKDGHTYHNFLGVPFAQPPVGALRFAKPEPATNWTTVRNATKFGKACWQTDEPFRSLAGEDCLTLDIYVPGNISSSPRAIMVWIHGGGYLSGSSIIYQGYRLALAGDVIVVSVQYRLGVFGFASTGDSELPGNFGLWDQLMAIQWVKDNAAFFGGDVSRITIFGESAGSSSVNLLSISPKSKGSFQRVISQSGTSLSPFAVVSKTSAKAAIEKTATSVGCKDTSTTAAILQCLRDADQETLFDASSPHSLSLAGDINFAPVVDGDFLPEDPETTLADKSSEGFQFFSNLDYIAGSNDAEGWLGVILGVGLFVDLSNGLSDVVFKSTMATGANSISSSKASEIEKELVQYYGKSDLKQQLRGAVDFFTDRDFLIPTVLMLNSRDGVQGKTYMYEFKYYRPTDQLLRFMELKYPSWATGANHADEIPFVFGNDYVMYGGRTSFTEKEEGLSQAVITMWTNFAKTGDPGFSWTTYDSTNKRYMEIDLEQKMQADLQPDRMKLWLQTIPCIIKPDSSCGSVNSNGGSSWTVSYSFTIILVTLVSLLTIYSGVSL